MYLSRTHSLADLLLFLCLSGLWTAGGWMLATHVFRLRRTERVLAGLATGWLLFITLSNLLAHWLQITVSFWLAALLVLCGGAAAAWRYGKGEGIRRLAPLEDLREWPLFLAVGLVTLLFFMIQRGTAIFDDFVHLPLVSLLAAGDFPPHFYGDPSVYFAYHYALQVYAASLVRVGGLFPWTAWDLSKALAIGVMCGLAWLWIVRLVRSKAAGWLGSYLVAFGGGARWLLLFLPAALLKGISANIQMTNSGLQTAPTFFQALQTTWAIEGGGPIAFPFAFHNGIFVPAYLVYGSTGALPFVTVLLLLLLVRRSRLTWAGAVVTGLILANLALSAEHIFAALWAGLALSLGIYLALEFLHHRPIDRQRLATWGIVLAFSAVLGVFQGGYLTEVARGVLLRLQGVQAAASNNYYGFSLRWPPGLPSAHLGSLSILNPSQLLALLAEVGPVILLAPVVTVFAFRRLKQRDWMTSGLGLAAALSLLFSLFIMYGLDRSETRMPATSLWLWLLLGFPLVWQVWKAGGAWVRFWLGSGAVVVGLAGVVLLSIQFAAIPSPQATYFVGAPDIRTDREFWDRLPPEAQVLDRLPERSVTIFGRASRSRPSIYESYPDWEALIRNPDPHTAALAGFSYVYMDDTWWRQLTDEQRALFQQECARKIYTYQPHINTFRILYDIRACR